MFESFEFESLTPQLASAWFGLLIGVAFGALGLLTRFCFRRAVVGDDRRAALGVWLIALAVAVFGTQVAVVMDLINFDDHRFMVSELPLLAIVTGGLLFGIGMVLTRGCISRLTVLTGSGNLRAAFVVIVFAIVAHATLKGVLAPLRVAIGGITVDLGNTVSLASLPGGALFWSGIIVAGSLAVAIRSGNRPLALLGGALIGLLVPVAWVGTGFILFDEFDPIAMQSLSFTSPAAESLFFTIASSAISAGFGTGLVGGVVVGALLATLLSDRFAWQSFESPRQTGRYLTGAALMGVGGVLAGGCTLGAGLAGIPTLSIAAILALLSIAAGGLIADAVIRVSGESGVPASKPAL
jgi:uncharacterized protein